MAVANFHYITRMSSGFKVYILEVYPVKRKRSHERGLTLEERRERVLSRSSGKVAQRTAPAVFNSPQSPTSTWSPTPSPTSPLPAHVYYTPVMDEPLALIKKPRKDTDNTEEKSKSNTATQIQVIHQAACVLIMVSVSFSQLGDVWASLSHE
ncbi:hypothetical protein INR49_025667 [Caranx melampygus]|nr:hypothetical protein INR49_025667 [Caranx melampygus]